MINHDIQELFDGLLNDEQTAELLHTLSVSPERRTDFRRHMEMQSQMGRDRAASALTSSEDTALWGAISAGIGIGTPAATAAGSSAFLAWVGRSAAVLLIGVGGYLLGSNSSTNSTDEPARSASAENPRAAVAAPRAPQTSPGASILLASHLSSATTIPVPSVVYRDRIVYRDRYISSSPAGTRHSRTRLASVDTRGIDNSLFVDTAVSNTLNQTNQVNQQPIELNAAQSVEPRQFRKANGIPAQPLHTNSDSLAPNSAGNTRSQNIPDDVLANRTGKPETPSEDGGSMLAALQTNGIEVAYSERIGRLASVPLGEEQSPNYAARYVDFSYRFDLGRYGLGMRVGTGTFSTVTLEPTQTVRREGALSRIDTVYHPSIGQSNENAVEFFFNYRLPITDRIALGAEMAYNISTTHQKVGGDLFALWFLTDRIGMQVGGGLSRYWYDIGGERQRLLDAGSNVGLSDDVLDSYTGSVLEGRYGLFYRF